MECNHVKPLLVRYVDDDLSDGMKKRVDEHLDHCYYCQEELQEIVSVLDTCRDLLRHPAPQDGFEALRPHLSRALSVPPPPVFRPKRLLHKLVALAAGIIVVLSVGDHIIRFSRQLDELTKEVMAEAPSKLTEEVLATREPDVPVLLAWRQRILWGQSVAQGDTLSVKPEAAPAPQSADQTDEPTDGDVPPVTQGPRLEQPGALEAEACKPDSLREVWI